MHYDLKRKLLDLEVSLPMIPGNAPTKDTISEYSKVKRENPVTVKEFRDKYSFLSNSYKCSVEWEGILYPSVSHALSATLTEHKKERIKISETKNISDVKKFTKDFQVTDKWTRNKYQLMYDLVLKKFLTDSMLEFKLLCTEGAKLVNGNHWHDNINGVCSCRECIGKPSENRLGEILTRVRRVLLLKRGGRV
jgi:predicted NAD-dependent protein-ADP-ribosyltransferase YbiA (DUF1768 family)